jgi:hypothetical protein
MAEVITRASHLRQRSLLDELKHQLSAVSTDFM